MVGTVGHVHQWHLCGWSCCLRSLQVEVNPTGKSFIIIQRRTGLGQGQNNVGLQIPLVQTLILFCSWLPDFCWWESSQSINGLFQICCVAVFNEWGGCGSFYALEKSMISTSSWHPFSSVSDTSSMNSCSWDSHCHWICLGISQDAPDRGFGILLQKLLKLPTSLLYITISIGYQSTIWFNTK